MIVYTDVAQMSPEWFELKRGIPSASGGGKCVSASTGKLTKTGAGTYCDELIEAALGLATEKDSWKSEDVDRGVEREPDARDLFQLETGLEIQQVSWITNDDGTAGCSPDGIIELPGVKMGWETKCPKARTHLGYRRDARPYRMPDFNRFELYAPAALPEKYKVQCHWAMAITGFQRWYFMSYHPDLDPFYVLVEANAFTVHVRSAINQLVLMLQEEAAIAGVQYPLRLAA